MERSPIARLAYTSALLIFSSTAASGATTYTLDDFLVALRKTGIKEKLEKTIEDHTVSRSLATKSALGLWSSAFEAEIGTSSDDERKFSIGLNRKFTIGADTRLIEKRYALEGEAERLSESREIRDQELQITKLYIKLRLQKAVAETSTKTLDLLKPFVKNIENAAQQGSIGYLASLRSKLLLGEVETGLGASVANYKSLITVGRDLVGISFPSSPTDANFAPLLGDSLKSDLVLNDYAPYKENLLRQDALASEASLVSAQREIGATVGLSREVRSTAVSVTLGLDMPILTGDIVSSKTRELQAARNVLAAKADHIAARGHQQFQIMRSEILAAKDRIERLELRLRVISELSESAKRGFKKGMAEAEAVTESISRQYEVSVQRHEAVAEYETLLAEMWTLTGGMYHAK